MIIAIVFFANSPSGSRTPARQCSVGRSLAVREMACPETGQRNACGLAARLQGETENGIYQLFSWTSGWPEIDEPHAVRIAEGQA
jgi:hypothetical protein